MMKFNIINKYRSSLHWIVVILWMALIFYLSAQPATQSDKLSKGLTEIVIETVEKVTSKSDFNMSKFNHLLRKNAHFFAYLVLGILVTNAMRKSGLSGFKTFALAIAICVIYAVSDEIHQLFVPGRGGQLKDVLIDSAGAMVGVGVYKIFKKINNK